MVSYLPAPKPHRSIGGFAAVCVDCADPPRLAAFYAALLGAPVEITDNGDASVFDLAGPTLDFLRVPERKTTKNRLHLDLRANDLEAAVEEALRLGATLAPDVYNGGQWMVLRDPEGNEFCLLAPRADGRVAYRPDEPPA